MKQKPTYAELEKEITKLRTKVNCNESEEKLRLLNQELIIAKDKAEVDKMYFQALVGNGNDVVTIINAQGDSIYQSPAREKVLGYKEDEIVNNLFEYIHSDDRERMLKQFQEFIPKLGKVEKMNYRYLHKNSTWRYIEGTGENMLNNSIVKGIVLNFRDVTERKISEQKLIDSEARLKESNKTKDKFLSLIAHDLRSPFNSILGFSNLLNKNFDSYDVKKQKGYLKIMHESIQNTYKLLDNLLIWANTQKGSVEFKPVKINIFLLSTEIIDLFNQMAEDKKIKILNTIPENIYVDADEDMLSAIIRNLISNALKFTKIDGKIIIDAKLKKDKSNKKYTEIIVKDSGVGISKEMQSKLFNIGINTSTQGTENETGTGLGLVLCKEFVEKHNGKIWIESEEGKGSIFYFTI